MHLAAAVVSAYHQQAQLADRQGQLPDLVAIVFLRKSASNVIECLPDLDLACQQHFLNAQGLAICIAQKRFSQMIRCGWQLPSFALLDAAHLPEDFPAALWAALSLSHVHFAVWPSSKRVASTSLGSALAAAGCIVSCRPVISFILWGPEPGCAGTLVTPLSSSVRTSRRSCRAAQASNTLITVPSRYRMVSEIDFENGSWQVYLFRKHHPVQETGIACLWCSLAQGP